MRKKPSTSTLYRRLRQGMSIKEALKQPTRRYAKSVVAISPEGETVLIDDLTSFAINMGWKITSLRTALSMGIRYKGWSFKRYLLGEVLSQESKQPEIVIDTDSYKQASGLKFVFRICVIEGLQLYWEAFLYPDLENPVASDIVWNPETGDYKWNCYNGAEGQTKSEVARKIISALDPELLG